MNIFDLIRAQEIAGYIAKSPSNAIPYLGATLFPAKKKIGLDLAWIRGRSGLPVALTPSEFDTKAPIRDRIGVSRVETEMPFFRESMRIGEKDRQMLNMLLNGNSSPMLNTMLTSIFDDAKNLVAGAEVQAERMRMQLLSTGSILIAANRMEYSYDYKFEATHKETLDTTARWSQTETATPISDIRRWMDKIEEDTGERPADAICTLKTWNYLMANKSIRLDMNPIGGTNIIMTDELLTKYLSAKLNLRVAVYSKKYALEVGGSASQFFPDEVFTLIPSGDLGSTWYGTTPEESDLMAGGLNGAEVSIVNTGIAVTTIKEPHPVNVMTVVSGIFLPSFEGADKVFIATVHH